MYYFLKRTYEPTHVLIRLPHLVWAKGEKVPISISVLQSAEMGLVGGKVSVEILDQRFERLWRQERAVLVKPGPSVNHVELGEFVIGPGLADHFFFLVAELRRSDERLLSRSVYWPRCLKLMEDTEFRARYRAVSRPSLVLDKGPWLRPQVAAMRTSLELEVSKHQDIGGGQTRLRVRVRNTGLQPAFLTQIDIRGTRRASYGTDNFFWLGPGETRFLDFRVRWRDPATRGQAAVIATAWNADLKEVPLRTPR